MVGQILPNNNENATGIFSKNVLVTTTNGCNPNPITESAAPPGDAEVSGHVPAPTVVRVRVGGARRRVRVLHQHVPLRVGVVRGEHRPRRRRVLVPAVRHPVEVLHVLVLARVLRVDVHHEDVAVGPHGVDEERQRDGSTDTEARSAVTAMAPAVRAEHRVVHVPGQVVPTPDSCSSCLLHLSLIGKQTFVPTYIS